ncbi:hypothetical protein GQX73_g842 [Xylaria multiplex]|uniref:NADP-dependent oxidoreductase domain-containing protein n=1 Tax=Xylaria multiplex TaxID=323545 RepID=A0A7C8N0L5_9PEZI|nr:hypothetical protein GQX73_g842 [Xylaria multiplex]
MVGHVNMMDDVLISNLPTEYLRSALRVLIAEGSATQEPFVRHVRQRLLDAKPELVPAKVLFPMTDELTEECTRCLAFTRCLFSSKMAQLSLPYLDHFVCSLRDASASWTADSELHQTLVSFAGDIVQAMQALKEVDPPRDEELESQLVKLQLSLRECRHYCQAHKPGVLDYPFQRSERQVADVLHIFYPNRPALDKTGDGSLSHPEISASQATETFPLGPFQFVPRLFNGFWQLSSPAWGVGSASSQDAALAQLLETGMIASDMADHYGDAELVYGHFRNRLPPQVKNKVFAATKWCVFGPIGHKVTNGWVLEAVQERCRRLGGRVELLQFHWYDYESKEYLEILVELISLTKSHPELVTTIGLCNFDSKASVEACEYLISKTGAVGLVSNQIQYLGMICDWGSWDDFQRLLHKLSVIAEKHRVTLTNVAIRWVLQKPQVGAGTRLGVTTHHQDNLSVFNFGLDEEDIKVSFATLFLENLPQRHFPSLIPRPLIQHLTSP